MQLDPSASESLLLCDGRCLLIRPSVVVTLVGLLGEQARQYKTAHPVRVRMSDHIQLVVDFARIDSRQRHQVDVVVQPLFSRLCSHGAVGTVRGYIATASTPKGRGKAIGTGRRCFLALD